MVSRGYRSSWRVSFEGSSVDRRVGRLFALVTEALAGATQALLRGEISLGSAVIEGDELIDKLTSDLEKTVWDQIDAELPNRDQLRSRSASCRSCRSWSAAPISPSTSPSVRHST